jgi:hypothetical protein
MSNLKFNLVVVFESNSSLQTADLKARVFSRESLLAVDRAVHSGLFGHYSKRRYFLSSSDLLVGEIIPTSVMLQGRFLVPVYPDGGRTVNPDLFRIFPAVAKAS